jgi:hypothetical protein
VAMSVAAVYARRERDDVGLALAVEDPADETHVESVMRLSQPSSVRRVV